jgi:hypothetical protein
MGFLTHTKKEFIMSVTSPEVTTVDETTDDSDSVAHIIKKSDWEKAYIMGEPVMALCGKLWVPHKNPDNLPMCGRCTETFREIFGQDFR